MPRARRDAKPSTTRFIVLLRALWLSVAAYGVSHAQVERRLCEWISEGREALRALDGGSPAGDRSEARRLIARGTAAEESGLARGDGRRDRAGGQRIGELLAGKYPRDAMPSRRRVEVCVDVLLEVLESKDPDGYADDRYGTRELWLRLWLQADQGHVPELPEGRATTVAGYAGMAREQLTAATTEETTQDTAQDRTQDTAQDTAGPESGHAAAEAEPPRERSGTHRREAVTRRGAAGSGTVGRPMGEPDRAPSPGRRSARIRTWGAVGLTALCVTSFLIGVRTGRVTASPDPGPGETQLISTHPYAITEDRPVTIPLRLPWRRDWYLDLRLALGHTEEQSLQLCSLHGRLTYQIESGGRTLPAARSPIGRREVAVNGIHLGEVADAGLTVTFHADEAYQGSAARQAAEPPPCELTLDPSRSVLRTAGRPSTPIPRRTPARDQRLTGKKRISIAVKIDQPGIGEIVDYRRRGIDIDVANYIAGRLGAEPVWHDVTSEDREKLIESGQADLVIASYSMNERRLDKIAFAGPYLIAGQDILIDRSDADTITGEESLRDKRVCGVGNSASTERLVTFFGKAWDTPRNLIRRNGYGQCVSELLAGRVDAVSTDNSLLAGYVAEHPDRLRLVGRPFSTEEYGIGLPKDATEDVARINAILRQMIDDGTWARSIETHLGRSAAPFLQAVPDPRP